MIHNTKMRPERNEISPFRNVFMPHNEKNTAFVTAITICNLITRHVVPSKLFFKKRIECVYKCIY